MVAPGSSKSAADLIKVFVPIMHCNCYASFGKLFSFCIIGGHYKDTDLMHGYQDYNNDADNVPSYIYMVATDMRAAEMREHIMVMKHKHVA